MRLEIYDYKNGNGYQDWIILEKDISDIELKKIKNILKRKE
jgi:hypothetical protein